MSEFDRLARSMAYKANATTVFDHDDFYQEARTAAWQAGEQYEPREGGNRTAFVIERMKWRMLDAQRAAYGRTHPQPLAVDILPEPDAEEPDDSWELHHYVTGLFPLLPWQQAVLLSLHYYAGIPLRTIGEALGVTESRVCQITRDGIARLQQLIRIDLAREAA